jgi:hypothetical protein
VERSRRLRDGTSWRTFIRLLRLDDLMTSYTHGRHIAIPEKSVLRLISRASSTGRVPFQPVDATPPMLTNCRAASKRTACPRPLRDNFGTFEKWELSGFRGVSDTNEAI